MVIAFITFNSSLVPLFEGLWSSNPWAFELSGFRRNWTDDLGFVSPSLWPTEPRLHVRSSLHLSHFWEECDALTGILFLNLWRFLSHPSRKTSHFGPAGTKKNLNGKKCDDSAGTETYFFSSRFRFVTYLVGCNNGDGGGIISKVKRWVAKWIGTRKRLFSGFLTALVWF